MAIQFLLVNYPEKRVVQADGAGVGFTNHTMMLEGDEYEITLDGGGYLPASQTIALAGTSIVKPLVISFAPAAAAPAPVVVAAEPRKPGRKAKKNA